MKNCNVTRYNVAVGGENPEYFGYTTIKVGISGSGYPATLQFSEAGKIIILDGKFTATNSREKSFAANDELVNFNYNTITPDIQGATAVSLLIPKYTCYKMVNIMPFDGVLDLDCFNYVDSAKSLTLQTFGATISDVITNLDSSLISRFVKFSPRGISYQNEVDLTQLGVNGDLTEFNMNECISPNVVGVLDNLGKSNIGSTAGFPKTKTISIDLVNFVTNNRNAGRTTGSVNMRNVGSCVVKANGNVIDVPAAQWDNVLEWTADSITFRGNPIS